MTFIKIILGIIIISIVFDIYDEIKRKVIRHRRPEKHKEEDFEIDTEALQKEYDRSFNISSNYFNEVGRDSYEKHLAKNDLKEFDVTQFIKENVDNWVNIKGGNVQLFREHADELEFEFCHRYINEYDNDTIIVKYKDNVSIGHIIFEINGHKKIIKHKDTNYFELKDMEE